MRKVIIVIEDNPLWIKRLTDTLAVVDATIESFSVFEEAEERILQKDKPFDLMITDIFENEESKEPRGITFANFVKKKYQKPVIVVTGATTYVRIAQQNENIDDVLDKGIFRRINFVESVEKILFQNTDIDSVTARDEPDEKTSSNKDETDVPSKGSGTIF